MNRLDLILLVDKDTAHHFHLLVFDSVLVSCSLQAFREYADALLKNLVVKSHLALALLLVGSAPAGCRRSPSRRLIITLGSGSTRGIGAL